MSDRRKIYLKGKTQLLKTQITSVLALNRILSDKDLGTFAGYPIQEYGDVSHSPYKLMIRFEANKQPPWRENKNIWKPRPTYQIPNIDTGDITWGKIKMAAGGENGYNWGHWRAYGKFDIGRMYVFGATQSEAEGRLKDLATLSKSKLERVTYSDLREMHNGSDRKIRNGLRVYPAYFTVINNNYDKNKVGFGKSPPKPKSIRVPLYTEKEPPGISEEVRIVLNSKFEYN